MTPTSIVEKIRKLRALSESSNPNEAAAAAAVAQKLMMRHHVEEAELGHLDEDIGRQGRIGSESHDPLKTGSWKSYLADRCAQSADCRLFFSARGTVLIGRKSDAESARFLYVTLATTIDRLAETTWRDSGSSLSSAREWKKAFRIGASVTVGRRLRESRKETLDSMPTSTAIVLTKRDRAVDRWIEAHVQTKEVRARASKARFDPQGLMAGMRAGESMQISTGQANLKLSTRTRE